MERFKENVEAFARLVTRDPGVETAWLSALCYIEELAAHQIRRNISDATPPESLAAIHAHADDELRHSEAFKQMMPLREWTEPRYQELEARLRRIIGNFVMGYFGNPVLYRSSSKHVAYVHGAQTIEQFPFQVYTAYLKATRLDAVKRLLPDVLRDEFGHLELGRKLMQGLSPEDRMSLDELNEIETEMCHRMILRMTAVVREFLGDTIETSWDGLAEKVAEREAFTVAWAQCFSRGEKVAAQYIARIFDERDLPRPAMMDGHIEDELRHSMLIENSVRNLRRKHLKNPDYVEMENAMLEAMDQYVGRLLAFINKMCSGPHEYYYFGALCLETRVFRHYKDIIATNDNIGLTHLLSAILKEETAHTSGAHEGLRKAGLSLERYRQTRELEQRLFRRLSAEWVRRMEAFEAASEPAETHGDVTLLPVVACV